MAPAKPPTDSDDKDAKDKQPSSPRKASAAAKQSGNNGVATPANRKPSAGPTPKSAPAAGKAGGGSGGVRKASHRKSAEPTLLGDFLLGRPSPARVAAARRRSIDAAAVKAELRREMREAAVHRVPAPRGVQARVKAWQRANAADMAKGNPAAAPSEPTDVAVHVDDDSVTEEDRVRIKTRQKPKRKPSTTPKASEETKPDNKSKESVESKESTPSDPRLKGPPKKRIVSDDNWMKRKKGKSPPRPTAKQKPEGSPSPIPKDFLQKTAKNPSTQDKIKDWAARVELPVSPELRTRPKSRKYSTKTGETITVEEDDVVGELEAAKACKGRNDDDGIRIKPTKPDKTYTGGDDGIRIKPVRSEEPAQPRSNEVDDGIRIKASSPKEPANHGNKAKPPKVSPLPDDGIRVRPIEQGLAEDAPMRSGTPRRASRKTSREKTERVPSTKRDRTPSTRTEVMEETETEIETPTRKSKSRGSSKMKRSVAAPVTAPATETATTRTGAASDDDRSWTDDDSHSRGGSDKPSTAPAKSLADIPFGFSAFSELDLPVGADHHQIRRPKAQRNSSFKAVPMAFKKIVKEAKEKVQERVVEPPKPVINQPPSIESWLNQTVDPFVDKSAPKTKSIEKEWEKDVRRRPSDEAPIKKDQEPILKPEKPMAKADREEHRKEDDHQEAPSEPSQPTSPAVGLKRTRATRGKSSPLNLKAGAAKKKPLMETLNELFKGESSGHKFATKAYSSYEDVEEESPYDYLDRDYEEERERYTSHQDERDNHDSHHEPRRHSSGTRRRSPSPESSLVSSSYLSTDVSSTDVGSNTEGPYMTPAIPRRRPPPTTGHHELSTIVSEESASTVSSETMTELSHTTVTQTTVLTRSTARSSRRSDKSGLKRRLTKHSDLVSVLSLPDTAGAPTRVKSIKSTRSLRRKTSKLEKATLDDLLREFAEDEDFYSRELKTLVDGAVPVLLTKVVHGGSSSATDLFGPGVKGEKAASAAKAVVSMGIALEKLKNYHRRVPLHDVKKILVWLDSVHPIYNSYLDVWRLGFEGIVVNLAPAPGRPDDEDSLVGALPRNEDGDVVDTMGQPVDLQRLLTRPLARIRGLLKLLKGARAIGIQHPELDAVIDNYLALQEKARRRHREETARKTDEDANSTDLSRCCDLRNLLPMDDVHIDQTRQVSAKDFFSLDLSHSNGQRLECQVELIFRDKPHDPSDKCDILIRDTGHTRYCLMFPPIPLSAISARKGDEPGVLIAMVRGRHNGREWHEVLKLSTSLDEQVADWIDILGTSPIPPSDTRGTAVETISTPSPKAEVDLPFAERRGENKLRKAPPPPLYPAPPIPGEQQKSRAPSRYRERRPSSPSTPTTPTSCPSSPLYSPSPDRTPTKNSYLDSKQRHSLSYIPPKPETRPLREDMRPDPKKLTKSPPNTTPYREDGAPPPPIHRTLSPKPNAQLSPPVDLAPSAARVRRRGSSPLKHEYHPSDASSDSSESESAVASESESSSDDEIEEDEVPETQPAISIKHQETSSAVGSVVASAVSDDSITPSISASQVGLYGRLGPGAPKDPEYTIKSIASISYWSNKKGQWKDVSPDSCSIVITPGLIEVFPLDASHSAPGQGALLSSDSSAAAGDAEAARMPPLIALELTPIVMIRQSTVLDLEIRSPVRPYSKLATIDGKIFRFRSPSATEGTNLYMAVHRSRLNNAKYKALEEEARFRSFGQPQPTTQDAGSQSSSSRRRRWFGRKNSYRASTRAPSQAPSQSQGTSSSISAPSLLKRLTGNINPSFNIDQSFIDRQSRPGSGGASLYTSGSSSAGGMTPPRSPSVSLAEASGRTQVLGSDNLKIRCHLLVSATKWEDYGNCRVQITRPPPGMRQELRIRHGMEKRVIVSKICKKDTDNPLIVLDVVLGSRCFSRLGARGIILNVWEEMRDENNNVGLAPAKGGLSGTVKKWCFQCSSATEASWIYGLVAQEVMIPGFN